MGVADVIEAMYTHRPYRPALGLDKALDEISKNRGILYDPVVVDGCVNLFMKKGFNFDEDMKRENFSPKKNQNGNHKLHLENSNIQKM